MKNHNSFKHGMSDTKVYLAWECMKSRCSNPNVQSYKYYGAKGVKVCEHWQLFENFYADMGNAPSPEHSLDRYPNGKGDYEPGNVRWATQIEQGNNRSSVKLITFRGRTQSIKRWAADRGMNYLTLYNRLVRRHWPVERALTEQAWIGKNQNSIVEGEIR